MNSIARILKSESPSLVPAISNVSRRRFLHTAGGLALGLQFGPLLAADKVAGDETASTARTADAGAAAFEPNAFVQIASDGTVTVIAKHLEMGQGVYTGLATLLAEELDADWRSIRVEGAPADKSRYTNHTMGVQGTGGSTAMADSYEPMRQAGAAARAMLVGAAAAQWQVPPQSLVVEAGVVKHAASGRQAGFGELAAAAAAQPVPADVKLKSPADFKLIGNAALPRIDTPSKTDGSAIFTQDIKLPGMLVAVALHPSHFGATVKSVNATKARKIPGVVQVVRFSGGAYRFEGVAVLATNTWAAKQGRDALQVAWNDSKAYKQGTPQLLEQYRAAAARPGKIAAKVGDVDAALASPAKLIEADYELPYLAHAAMEPMNCLVKLDDSACEIWNGEQFQTVDQQLVGDFLGIAPDRVRINQLFAGGSFGRRANPHADYILEAVAIARAARAMNVNAPIKLVWMREDDMRAGYYRPLNLHRARIALDQDGNLQAWHVRLVGQAVMAGTLFEGAMKNGIDPTSVEGQADLPYDVPNLQVEATIPDGARVPIQWFRSVGHSHTAFSSEGLIDEAAVLAGRDPVAFRLGLLGKQPRYRGVLQLAADKAQWAQALPAGAAGERRGRGVAVHKAFDTYVAQIAEITVKADGSLKVDRVVCAVDCGAVVNPDIVKAQMEGGIGFALGVALHGAITLKDGMVEQSNFNDYQVLRMDEMPRVEVYIVASTEKPTGVGEPGVPPLAPALVNAIYNAVGKRLRKLPIAGQLSA
ncbi:MAG: iorB1 [Herbaspirillum sp.]|nr:iorB1 [Herbaspirillum sp.]